MQPKGTNGEWLPNFDPLELTEKGGFCESNSAIYSHYVPHDMQGLIELYGGHKKYAERLNENFIKSEPYGFSVQKIPNQVIGLITVTNQARAWPIFSIMLGHHG